jgi:hypothetical protein
MCDALAVKILGDGMRNSELKSWWARELKAEEVTSP